MAWAVVLAILVLSVLHPLLLTTLADESDNNRDALLCLKSRLSITAWNTTSPDFCSWRGVSCTRPAQLPLVVALDLEAQGLAGEIPLCMSNLTSLVRIHLPNNQLSGNLPPEIGRLTGLRYLNLSSNALSGEIPESLSLCSSLEILALSSNSVGGVIPPLLGTLHNLSSLDLSSNKLSGEIPPLLGSSPALDSVSLTNNFLEGEIPLFLANCSSLRYLSLQNNSLSGAIPSALFNSSTITQIHVSMNNLSGPIPPFTNFPSKLNYLDLTGNSLTGTVPPSVGNLTRLTGLLIAQNQLQGNIPDLSKLSGLQFLDLSYNNLSGIVPPSIYSLPLLSFLGLANNNLRGTLPSDMGNTLSNMNSLIMSNNHFEGEIPASLANASSMEFLYLGNNSLSGVVPSFGSMSNLQVVMLHSNQLEAGDWAFFSSLANCSQLQKLNLGENKLRGNLPASSFATLPKSINGLTLQSNYISGTIPLEIGNLSEISLLYLDNNLFTGPIPSTLGQLRNLFILNLSRNKFSGEIPPSIGNLNQLTEFYLQENELSGSIPTSLAGCQKLVALNLSSNGLNGSINGPMFSKLNQLSWLLDLSHNQFTDSIPPEIGSLINLGSLNLSHNKLTGKIPSALGECIRLEALHLDGNLLEGSIPQSLANLKGVKALDFSQNNLSGTIPEFLETFTSLQYLNMSFNNFEGPVPIGGAFANRSSVSVQGNALLCSNVQLNDLPRCSTSASQRKHKFIVPLLAALSAVVALALILGLVFLVFHILRKKRRRSSQSIDHTYTEFKRLTYNDVSKATNGFSPTNIVGSGQFGIVYKGQLDGKDSSVAVKVFKLNQYGALDSFIAECKALRNIRHRNLVGVITACSTYDLMGNEFKALVFEYMANGSLENRLHAKLQKNADLSLGAVICIAVDIASALEYLHNQCIPPVVHCDLKPSNILFDDDDTAYVCDFGLARLIHGYSSEAQSNSTSISGPRGTIGYIAPEYGMGSQISTDGDVYSYGIILLEMLTGKRPTDEAFSNGLTLQKYVDASLSEIEHILHPSLMPKTGDQHTLTPKIEEYKPTTVMHICALQLLKLGLLCSVESPKDRPSMHEIYSEVMAVKEAFFSMNS
ncbi:LRR receptor-like serine/threonine-protein kinase EFR [Triticum urartu]|nr:LRR receptor-like serine/threonine-protein kinase EFR [Triticum urartu]